MVEFKNLSGKRIDTKPFKKLYKKIFAAKKNGFELSVVFAGPALMKKLNKDYRNRNKTTNVLAFLLEKGWPKKHAGRGEIFLNAKEKNLPYLFLHGALHLLGYDHKNKIQAKKMEKIEKTFLKNI